ncbi:MAG: GNAT family N-acetyltransferase [Acidobacteria bacterium]|nr:GNAT family N-acetyltransferase [Acidobacteriota bacterium]
MTRASDLRPASSAPADLRVDRVGDPIPELNRFFYTAIGGAWFWIDRLAWSRARWVEWLSRAGVETWVASVAGVPAGYAELQSQPGDEAEIVYFGLLPQFAGKGYGGAFLTLAARRAWELGPRRVWVHTCSLDHPRALDNYLRRGFRLFKEETAEHDMPDVTPGPWPGWDA